MIVLAVCGGYLQVIATKARVKSAHAQLDTATALYNRLCKSESSDWRRRSTSTAAKSNS